MMLRPIFDAPAAPRPGAASGRADRIPQLLLIGVVNTGFGQLPPWIFAYADAYLLNAVLLHQLLKADLSPFVAQALALVPTVALSYLLVSLTLGVPEGKRENRQ